MDIINVLERRKFDADRYLTQLLHDSADARVVVFGLQPGQVVEPHTSPSSVFLYVVEGRGTFSGSGGEAEVGPGGLVVYAPDEPHGIVAGDERLTFLAVIAPRPG